MNSEEQIDFEEYLAKYGSLTYRNKGASMMPLLKEGRDLFTLAKKGPERCKKYDVVLYKGPGGQYILHRIIKVREDDYVIRGDNTYRKEYYKDDDILGVMTSFVHNGKSRDVTDTAYKVYSVLRCASYPLRAAYMKARRLAARIIKGRRD